MKTNVIIDLSNVTFVTHFSTLKKVKDFNQDYLIFQTINFIKIIAKKYKADGVLIACDSPNVWRKDVYPDYKANRKESRDPYYEDVKEAMIIIKDFFNDYTSIPAVSVDRAEADDIIAVATQESKIRTVIVSSDRDFKQLLNENVILYSPSQKEERTCDDIGYELFEKCIRGDTGDNIKSAYPRVRATVLKDAWQDSYKMINLLETVTKQGNIVKNTYFFNKSLIDLTQQPDYIKLNIIETLKNLKINKYNGQDVLRFIGKHDMKGVSNEFLRHKEIFRKHYIS